MLNYVRKNGAIRRVEVIDLCRLSDGQVKGLLKHMKTNDFLLLAVSALDPQPTDTEGDYTGERDDDQQTGQMVR